MVKGEPTGPACRQFDPPCSWDKGWYAQPPFKASVDVEGDCSGDWTGGQILDRVKIPKDLPPGDWVLGWRCAQPYLPSALLCPLPSALCLSASAISLDPRRLMVLTHGARRQKRL